MAQTPALFDSEPGVIDYTPSGAVIAGQVVLIGTVPHVAPHAIADGIKGALAYEGLWKVPQVAAILTAGDAVYWDENGSPVTGTALSGCATGTTSGNNLMGFAAYTTAATDSYAYVVLTAAKRTTTIAGSVTADSITGSDSTLTIVGLSAAQGGLVSMTGALSTTSGNAGGASSVVGGVGGATGAGGAAVVTGGASGATSGTGGAATITGGAAGSAAGNAVGGAASVTGGAGKGNLAGGAGSLVGGEGGATGSGGAVAVTGGATIAGAGGTGGAVTVTGGANANTTNGAGGPVTTTGGAGKGTGDGGEVGIAGGAAAGSGDGGAVVVTTGTSGSGIAGNVHIRAKMLGFQDTPETATATASLSDAQVLSGILVGTPSAVATYTLRTGTEIEAALGGTLATGDFFDLTIINLGGAGDIITLAGAAGMTIVGAEEIDDDGADVDSSGTFRFVRGAANVFVAYRLG